MNTTAIRNYAQQARRDFRKLVTEKAQSLGIDKDKIEEAVVRGDALIVHGQAMPASMKKQRDELVSLVKAKGFGAVVDEMAYTLFNRFSALRFMEVHDYLPQRVFSAKDGSDTPDILRNALDVIDTLIPSAEEKAEIRGMRISGTKDQELYRRLIIAQCNALATSMPFLFESRRDYSELLMPDNLLLSDSVVRVMVGSLDDSEWQEIEIIGWLYQFYISERKDEVIGSVVAKATELQMYYWGQAEESDVYEANKTNPYYLGSVTLGQGDYDGMYAVTKAILDQGRTKLVFANGGADFGVTMFVNRKAGFQAAVDEAKGAGKTIEVTEVPGFPNESWFAAQGAALAKDIDAVVTSFSADVWAQPIAAANKSDQVIVGAFGGITDFYQQVFDSGLVTAIAAEPTERFGIAVAQILNAVDGNAAALQDDGAPTNLTQELWVIKSKDEYGQVAAFEAGEGRMQYSQELTRLIKNLNPDASVATLQELIEAYSLEAIVAGD